MRYRSRRACDAAVRLCIRGLAAQRRRFGYRRLHLLLTDAVEKAGCASRWALAVGLIWEVKGRSCFF